MALVGCHRSKSHSCPLLTKNLVSALFVRGPVCGDSFCGGGYIPIEAARIGCEALSFDFNPVAGLLTHASFKLLGGDTRVLERCKRFGVNEREYSTWWKCCSSFSYEAVCPQVQKERGVGKLKSMGWKHLRGGA